MNAIQETPRDDYIRYRRFFLNSWLLVPEVIIRPVASVSTLT